MLKEGLQIRDYTLKTFLGKGSFGEVWLAEKRIEIADKTVPFALKFISDNTHGISDYANVKREINTWIDASGHKNIIGVLDGFLYENLFVIVSEYANNGSLRQWLRTVGGRAAGLEKTVEIMCGILDGLTHLHAQKIIHRDLKPENVLLKGDDVPCIADFGVSRIVETVSLDVSAGTNTAGSPLYMSPESFERIKPSPQIDIWSAGVMLFEMLSGKTPYSSDTIPGLIYEIVTKEPRSLPADIPQSFHQVIKKSLAKDVADRFSSAKEMRDALMRALYSQHHSTAVSAETIAAEENDKRPANGKSGVDMLRTLPLSREISAADIRENKNGNKKTLAWIALGAVAILASAFGVYTLTQSSADATSNQNNNAVSNQTTVPANAVLNSNSASNELIVQPQNVAPPIEKQPEKTNVEKQKTQSSQKTTKAETAPKKDAPKQTQKANKKVTLDDLIN